MKKIILPLSILGVFGASLLFQSYSGGIEEKSAFHYAMAVNGKSAQISSTAESCNICHGGSTAAPDLSNEGGLTFAFSGNNDQYSSGITYMLDLTVDADNAEHGYELIALDTLLNGVGSFTTTTGTSGSGSYTVDGNAVTYPYAKHNMGFSSPTFNTGWTAPTTYQGPVTFYAISVSADGDGNASPAGDAVFYNKLKITHSSNPVSLEELDAQDFFNLYSSNGSIEISTDLDMENASIEIYDVLGRVSISETMNGSQLSVPVSAQNSIVFVKIQNQGKTYTTKMKI